jgi:hypothetical protein
MGWFSDNFTLKNIVKTVATGGLYPTVNVAKNNLLPGAPNDSAGEAYAREEARKAELRRKIDLFYGISPSKGAKPQELAEAKAAAEMMEGQGTDLSNATRGYYTEQLGKQYEEAERKTRFRLARQGLLGGSEDVFQQGELKSNRDLGATRVDDAVQRAVSAFKAQREQERLNAVNLVNSGAGDSAVTAAQTGLRNSLDNAKSAEKQNLFTDLFSNGANAVTVSNMADQQAALLGRYRDRVSSFFPATGSSSGRITPSA